MIGRRAAAGCAARPEEMVLFLGNVLALIVICPRVMLSFMGRRPHGALAENLPDVLWV